SSEIDYKTLDLPTVMRNRPAPGPRGAPTPLPESQDADYLDIPAFLRRQAD
ncbi:MAG: cell division protein FtsZ, partial [Gammaproteobacteria bacterium]